MSVPVSATAATAAEASAAAAEAAAAAAVAAADINVSIISSSVYLSLFPHHFSIISPSVRQRARASVGSHYHCPCLTCVTTMQRTKRFNVNALEKRSRHRPDVQTQKRTSVWMT